MKKIILLFTAVILGTVVTFAAPPEKLNLKERVRSEIGRLLKDSNFYLDDYLATAEIEVLVDNKGKITVLSVDCRNQRIGKFIKQKLHNKSMLRPLEIVNAKRYTMSVKLVGNN